MRDEIRQNGEPLLWAEGEEWTSIPMIFQNITGKNFTGQEYRAYIENWILHQGFELGPVELLSLIHICRHASRTAAHRSAGSVERGAGPICLLRPRSRRELCRP